MPSTWLSSRSRGPLTVVAIGMTRTNAYPQRASWSRLLFALATTTMGFVRVFAESSTALEIAFAVPAGLTSVVGCHHRLLGSSQGLIAAYPALGN